MNPFLITNTPLLKLKAVVILLMVIVGCFCDAKNCASQPVKRIRYYSADDNGFLSVVNRTNGSRRYNLVTNADETTMYVVSLQESLGFLLYHMETKTFICYHRNRNGRYKLIPRRKLRKDECSFMEVNDKTTNAHVRLVPCFCRDKCEIPKIANPTYMKCPIQFKSKKSKRNISFIATVDEDCKRAKTDVCEHSHVTRHEHIKEYTSLNCPPKRTQ